MQYTSSYSLSETGLSSLETCAGLSLRPLATEPWPLLPDNLQATSLSSLPSDASLYPLYLSVDFI